MYKWFPNELLNKFRKIKIQLLVMKVPQNSLGLKLLLCLTIFLHGQLLFVPEKELLFFFLPSLRSKGNMQVIRNLSLCGFVVLSLEA